MNSYMPKNKILPKTYQTIPKTYQTIPKTYQTIPKTYQTMSKNLKSMGLVPVAYFETFTKNCFF